MVNARIWRHKVEEHNYFLEVEGLLYPASSRDTCEDILTTHLNGEDIYLHNTEEGYSANLKQDYYLEVQHVNV